ncbi:MAG: hypothetical protein ONB27_08385 [candidate division KSB1 bacterium]|nr:hypothetical protein [candidate division KSB1 bacterium]
MTNATLGRQHWLFIVIGLFLWSAIIGNFFYALSAEKPLPNHPKTLPLPQQQDSKQSDQPKISDDAVKMFLKEIEIYGQIAKPQAVFIIPGTDPRVDGLRIERHFFSHIFRPVERSALHRVRNQQEQEKKDHILW